MVTKRYGLVFAGLLLMALVLVPVADAYTWTGAAVGPDNVWDTAARWGRRNQPSPWRSSY